MCGGRPAGRGAWGGPWPGGRLLGCWLSLAVGWAVLLKLPGRLRAGLQFPCRAVPTHGRGVRPKPGHGERAGPAWARIVPVRVMFGPGKLTVLRIG